MSEWRQERPRNLTAEQLSKKLQLDLAYEAEVNRIYTDAKAKGTLTDAKAPKDQLYYLYRLEARANGLEVEVTDKQLKAEAESVLQLALAKVNGHRAKLGIAALELADTSKKG